MLSISSDELSIPRSIFYICQTSSPHLFHVYHRTCCQKANKVVVFPTNFHKNSPSPAQLQNGGNTIAKWREYKFVHIFGKINCGEHAKDSSDQTCFDQKTPEIDINIYRYSSRVVVERAMSLTPPL